MHEALRRLAVRKCAHFVQPLRQLGSRRRRVKDRPVWILHANILVLASQSPDGARLVHRVVANGSVNVEHPIRRHRGVFHFHDALHRQVIIQDHSLASITRRTTIANHFLGHLARRNGAFKLARRDRFLYEAANQISIFHLRFSDGVGHLDDSTHAQVDSIQVFRY